MGSTFSNTAKPKRKPALRWSLAGIAPRLAIHGFELTERISSLFALHARLSVDRTESKRVDSRAIIGQIATIDADFPSPRTHVLDGAEVEIERRFFTGIVTGFAEVGDDDRRVYYSAEVSPWLWLLSQTSDCRVFQNLSVIEIVTKIFDELQLKFPGIRYRLRDADSCYERPKRDCCVQYNETSLNFVSRLLEEEGIYYYFEHRFHEQTLMLAAQHHTIEQCLGQQVAMFHRHRRHEGNRLESWSDRVSLTPGRYTLSDYHEQMTAVTLIRSSPTTAELAGNRQLEVYEDHGNFAKPFNEPDRRLDQVIPTGDRLAKTRIEEIEVGQRVIEGTSDCLGFTTGYQFERETHDGQRDAFLLTEVHHTALQSEEIATGEPTVLAEYHNRFECVPANGPYRPPRLTARPVIPSVQTARVVPTELTPASSENTEEIVVDKLGRVRVQFHWDRRAANDDGRTSAWIRVGQGWASNGFGMHFWPRVGDEVIVAFLNGDPDCPIVVGSVYNDRNVPPYKLPEEKTKSGIKTKSSKNGVVSQHFNELRFEDKTGDEQVYLHAERNLDTVVEAAESRTIGATRRTEIGAADATCAGEDAGHKIVEELIVHGKRLTVLGIQGENHYHMMDDLTVHGAKRVTVKGGERHFVDADFSIESGDQCILNSKKDTTLTSNAKIILNATDAIELKVGLNTLRIDQAGIWMDALNVDIQGKLLTSVHAPLASLTADVAATVNGPLTNILSSGPLILKGVAAGITY